MLRIEYEPPVTSTCACCPGTTTRLTRFVYRNEDAHAIYYAQFSDNHPDRMVAMLVSLGEWGEDSTPEQRRAFALCARSTADSYQVTVTDASVSPWQDARIVGPILDREEALKHPWLPEVFHLTDHAFLEDAPLRAYLQTQGN